MLGHLNHLQPCLEESFSHDIQIESYNKSPVIHNNTCSFPFTQEALDE